MSLRIRTVVLALATLGTWLGLTASVSAQLQPASPPLADANDKRFVDVTEDWSTPSLSKSHLLPIPTLKLVDDSHPDYTVDLVRAQWRFGDPIDIYVIKPNGVKNPPVILNLYGFPADTDAYKIDIFQKDLIKGGFAAVGFVSALTGQRYHDRPMKEWFISELQESLGTSAHDVQMVMDYLASRGDLDMGRVGMFGQGTGATIAILASAVDPRIKVLDVLDPWGDWPKWMATSPVVPEEERADYVKPDYLKKAATLETLDWLPKVQARSMRLQQNVFGLDTPKPIADEIRAAVRPGTTIQLYQTPKDFNTAFPHSINLDWIKQQLQLLPHESAASASKH